MCFVGEDSLVTQKIGEVGGRVRDTVAVSGLDWTPFTHKCTGRPERAAGSWRRSPKQSQAVCPAAWLVT